MGCYEAIPSAFPGTGEDLAMAPVSVNGAPSCTPVVAATDVFAVHFGSPGGDFVGTTPLLLGQAYPAGMHPGSILPDIHVNAGAFLLFDGGTILGPFGPLMLAPPGLTLPYTAPFGLSGIELLVQALVLAPMAQNGIYATTDAAVIAFE